MNSLPKVVFSRTLSSATWQNTRLVKDNIEEEVIKLKAQPGRDLIIWKFGLIRILNGARPDR